MKLSEERIEHHARKLVEFYTDHLLQLFKQLGQFLDLISFYLQRDDEEPTYQFGHYYLLGFFVIGLGLYLMFSVVSFYPPIEFALMCVALICIGLVLNFKS